MAFRALLLDKDSSGQLTSQLTTLEDSALPEGDVTVAVEYSSLNYKDGLCLTGAGGLVRHYPHVGGIDFAGRVLHSQDPRYQSGDPVVLTGWRVGENHWGGYAERARVRGDWLVPLPEGLSPAQAMAVGTAGLTAMLAVMALEAHGLTPERGPVLVTGAAGGVGSVAITLLHTLGYEVAAVTGRPEIAEYLKSLGATQIIARDTIATTIPRPLESELWAGAIDTVGGPMLARLLGQIRYGGSVAAIGLAGGASLPASVIPFLLRGINLLGIDSVMCPRADRLCAWARIAKELPLMRLESLTQRARLEDLPKLAPQILAGQIQGRVLIDLSA